MPDAAEAQQIDDLVDQTGRPLGTRALQTRQRILDATIAELATKPIRDLRVIDIARRVGSSPATFYQYFKDIEDAVLTLSVQTTEGSPPAAEFIVGDWSGAHGFERGKNLVSVWLEHWANHGTVLRVRNNASDEGDVRFQEVRVRAVRPIIDAFVEQLKASHQQGREERESGSVPDSETSQGKLSPGPAALMLFFAIDRLAMNYQDLVTHGTSHEEIVETGATMLQVVLTSQK